MAAQPLELRALLGVQRTQLLRAARAPPPPRRSARRYPRRSRQARADGARGELGAQPREALVDRRAHRREAHQLRQAPPLRRLDEIVHADARAVRRAARPPESTFGGTPKSMSSGAAAAPARSARERPRRVEHRLAAAGRQHHGGERRRLARNSSSDSA